MIRYFSITLATFGFLVALALAQDNAAPKKKGDKEPDAKNVDKDAKKPDEKAEDKEDRKKIIERLNDNFKKVDEALKPEDEKSKPDPGNNTQKTQQQIADDLKKLIDENDPDGGGGGGTDTNFITSKASELPAIDGTRFFEVVGHVGRDGNIAVGEPDTTGEKNTRNTAAPRPP